MKTGVLKLTALSVVLGIGVLVVMQAQRTLDDKKSTSEDEQDGEGQLGADADETPRGLVGDPDGELDDRIQQTGGESGDDEDDVVPAARKLSRANRPQPRRPTATPTRRPSRNSIDDEDLDSERDDAPETNASPSDSDEPRSPARRATADRTEDQPTSRTIRLKSLPVDADDEPQDDTESAGDESVSSSPRKTVVTPPRRTGGLSVPDDEDESLLQEDRKAQPASKSSKPSTARDSRKSVIPASGEDDAAESIAEADESSLGSNLADSDEGFKPREKPATESPRSKTPPARSRFTDDEEDAETEPAESPKSESSTAKGGRAGILSEDDEASDEAADPGEASKAAKHGEPSKLVDDESDEAPLAGNKASKNSAAKNRFAEDDEPVGGADDSDADAADSEAPPKRTETIAKNPSQGGR
ncbi:MAG: hypothetical protein NT069_31745, partial [Planctomycetota bacterium]|nr:hypothetical protein [Planctomycetota bacterium]